MPQPTRSPTHHRRSAARPAANRERLTEPRWYNPDTATFNSQDTVTAAAGAASAVLNLYTYAGGNPLTYNDPDGHMYKDPGGIDSQCYHDPKKPIGGYEKFPKYDVTCDPPPPHKPVKPSCQETHTCKCPPGTTGKDCHPTDGGCKGKGCDTGCKTCGGCKPNCDPPCKSTSCQPKPPPPPVCDAQCQLKKKIKQERDDLEQDAKTVKQPPPGNPVCAAGNPLCPTNPAQPATVVTSGGDLTNETAAWSNQQYQNALNATGSVINASTTGTYNWFDTSYKPPAGGGSTGGGGVAGVAAGTGILIPPEAVGVVGGLLGIAWAISHIKTGGGAPSSGSNSGAVAPPPDPDNDRRGGGHPVDESYGTKGSGPKGGVYTLRDVDGNVVRTGRTNDFARREYEHGRNPDLSQYEFRREYGTDDYATQRGLEKLLHDKYEPPLDKIKPISPLNPRIGQYEKAAERYLNGGG